MGKFDHSVLTYNHHRFDSFTKAIGIEEFTKIAESHLKKVDNGILKNRLNRVHGLLTF